MAEGADSRSAHTFVEHDGTTTTNVIALYRVIERTLPEIIIISVRFPVSTGRS